MQGFTTVKKTGPSFDLADADEPQDVAPILGQAALAFRESANELNAAWGDPLAGAPWEAIALVLDGAASMCQRIAEGDAFMDDAVMLARALKTLLRSLQFNEHTAAWRHRNGEALFNADATLSHYEQHNGEVRPMSCVWGRGKNDC